MRAHSTRAHSDTARSMRGAGVCVGDDWLRGLYFGCGLVDAADGVPRRLEVTSRFLLPAGDQLALTVSTQHALDGAMWSGGGGQGSTSFLKNASGPQAQWAQQAVAPSSARASVPERTNTPRTLSAEELTSRSAGVRSEEAPLQVESASMRSN